MNKAYHAQKKVFQVSMKRIPKENEVEAGV